jgi:hypothetical protein
VSVTADLADDPTCVLPPETPAQGEQ